MADVKPARPRHRMRWFLAGMVAGCVTGYLLDPRTGHSRRTRLADEAEAEVRRGLRWTRREARHAMSDAAGAVARSQHHEPVPVDDLTLVDRVQSELFEDPTMPKADLLFEAVKGVVTIRGQLQSQAEVDRVGTAVLTIPGVIGVRNLLHVPGTPAPNKEAVLSS